MKEVRSKSNNLINEFIIYTGQIKISTELITRVIFYLVPHIISLFIRN